MAITETEYLNVSARAAELGCPCPEIAIMPDNFAAARSLKELRIRSAALALRSVLENASFPLGSFCAAAEHATFNEEDFAHWEAAMFVSAALMRREPYVVAVALSIIRAHLAGYFGEQPNRLARLVLIIEKRDRTCRKITYEGDVSGLRSLADSIGRIAAE